jgi:hypothetical protein
MEATPASTAERLGRAERLVRAAAEGGAQLIVLPELFNTGYGYRPENHALAEPLTGPTPTWLKQTAIRLRVYLAGSLMLLDGDEVYNSLLLFAPDGRMWRYDKNYPWGWERGYFREVRGITIAQTDLGDIGMLICWDAAHPDLWRRYAGQVELMIVASCPPDVSNPTYHFPAGARVTLADMGPLGNRIKDTGRLVFDDMIRQQTAWLGVPAVCTGGCGQIETGLPNGLATLAAILPGAPWLVKYLPQAGRMQLACGFVPACQVLDGQGQVVAASSQEQGETFILGEIILTGQKPVPDAAQPASLLPWLTYFFSDIVLPALTISVYRRGLRRTWGARMAPLRPATWRRVMLIGLVALGVVSLGLLMKAAGRRR